MNSDKKSLTEQEIRTRYITPSILKSGWDLKQIREEYFFTDGRIIVRGKLVARGKRKYADYLLNYKSNMPLAIIEAKDNKHSIGEGMQQALSYGEALDIPFTYSSNGDGFLEHDNLTGQEKELKLHEFPSPEELWERYKKSKHITENESKIIEEDYFFDESGKSPRYYQRVAINRTIEAVAKGQDRILLVMATGTGKTYTAFQIVHRLWKSGTKKRILFLADRTALIDQTMSGDFKHFGATMTRLSRKNTSKAHEIFLSLYQSVSGSEEEQNVYKDYSRDFFDLIIVDECHRGSAREDSAWREILDYFSGATQIGLTATPKETKDVSNIHYFGEPIYTYSLRQGIDDGFLAPYKVIRVVLDKDAEGYRPVHGSVDKYGNVIEDREYTRSDFERTIVLEKRREIVAKRITEFLKATNRLDKVIVFCEDTEHAEAMRSLLSNTNYDLTKDNNKYVVRITGNDEYGKAELDNFIDPGSKYPVIATTSELLSTGVDTQTVKLIVIDKGINSIGLFKQMIGRGTRIKTEYGKQFFTIMDFTGATRHFADPEFDGDPVMIYEPGEDDPILPDEEDGYSEPTGQEGQANDEDEEYIADTEFTTESGERVGASDENSEKVKKYYIDDVEVQIINETVKYYDKGKLKTESLKDFTVNNIKNEYATLDIFIKEWNSNRKKKELLTELENNGVYLDAVREELGEITKDLDDFDLILFLAYDQKPLTRSERVSNLKKKDLFENYSETSKKVLNGLLEKYQDEGIVEMENIEILRLDPFRDIGSLPKIMKEFGSKKKYIESIKKLEKELYA